MSLRLNWDIVKRNVDTETADIIDKVRGDVDSAVNGVIGGYQAAIEKRISDFNKGNYDSGLKEAEEKVAAQLTADMKTLNDSISEVKKLAETAKGFADKADGANLTKAATDLETKTTELQKVLDEYQKKVENFGSTAGKYITSSVAKAIFG